MDINPIIDFKNDKESACRYCDFKSVCNFSQDVKGMKCRKNIQYKNTDLMEKIQKAVEGDDINEQ